MEVECTSGSVEPIIASNVKFLVDNEKNAGVYGANIIKLDELFQKIKKDDFKAPNLNLFLFKNKIDNIVLGLQWVISQCAETTEHEMLSKMIASAKKIQGFLKADQKT